MTQYGLATEAKITEVVTACEKYGDRSIIALAGVPGTGKSFIAQIAAQRFTREPSRVRSIQFHPAYSYEEFIEGLRFGPNGGVMVEQGIFLQMNEFATLDPHRRYVLLVEEFTRADVVAVLGETLTHLEHRSRTFQTLYSRTITRIAPNLVIVVTYNPSDRSAINMDQALLRRLRSIPCPPSVEQLEEMLSRRGLQLSVITKLQELFAACLAMYPEGYEYQIPFGHGIFAEVQQEVPDLYDVWEQRIRPILYRPLHSPHPFADVIKRHYPWQTPMFRMR